MQTFRLQIAKSFGFPSSFLPQAGKSPFFILQFTIFKVREASMPERFKKKIEA